jgi:hypothetical protein
MKKVIFVLTVLVLTSCSSDYSSGYRTGYLTKFSEKGMIYTTWEGEINLGGFASDSEGKVTANVFQFSLDDESQRGEDLQALSDTLNLALELGYRIKVHYNQEVMMDWDSSRGSTDYYVDEVVILRE